MRIALISTPFVATPPRGYGGTELVVADLADGLVARGHQVTVFGTGDSHTTARHEWLYERAQWPPQPAAELQHSAWALHQIARAARRGRPYDVVHAHTAPVLACARLLRPRPVLVYTIHHERDETLSAFYRAFPRVHYVAISADQAAREEPLPRLSVVHHGLSAARYACRPTPQSFACFVGRFAPAKAPHLAIDAAAAAGLRIRIAGSVHPTDREYGATVVAPRLRLPHVEYLGGIGIEQKAPLLRDARVTLVPLQWEEPFGLVMIEAMLSGCPVVAFPRGSAPELIEPGVTGFLVRDVQEMAELIRIGGPLDRFDRVRCRARAIERFSRTQMVDGYERVYARACARAALDARRTTRSAGRTRRAPAVGSAA